jgi:hypothetical protein
MSSAYESCAGSKMSLTASACPVVPEQTSLSVLGEIGTFREVRRKEESKDNEDKCYGFT